MSLLVQDSKGVNFNIKFTNTCYVCQNPTVIIMELNNPVQFVYTVKKIIEPTDLFAKTFMVWRKLKPLDLRYNASIYKKFGSVVRKVCISCYGTQIKCHQIKREVGIEKFNYKSNSLSSAQIFDWFDRFNDFRNRPNIKEYVDYTYKNVLFL